MGWRHRFADGNRLPAPEEKGVSQAWILKRDCHSMTEATELGRFS